MSGQTYTGNFDTRQEAIDASIKAALEANPSGGFTIKACVCDGRRLAGLANEARDAYVRTCPECEVIQVGKAGRA